MRIGIFGGSFDPPHNGHLALARAAVGELSLDKLYFVPALNPPHAKPKYPAEGSLRLAMLRAAIKCGTKFAVDDFELRRRSPTYTYQSIDRFRRRFPRADLFFVLGSDSLADVPSWRKGLRLLAMCRFAAGRRSAGTKKIPVAAAKKAVFLKARLPDVSSSTIRRNSARPGGLKRIPAAVAQIIRKNNLYADVAIADYLKRHLDRAKYRHTLRVASLAGELAERHGADPRRAVLAALIHDMGRTLDIARYKRYAGVLRGGALPSAATCRANPFLLHSYISAHMAAKIFGVRDREVLAAAANHTLGAPAAPATVYDDIIYVADACAPDRRFPGVAAIRRAAFRNLGEGVLRCAAMKLAYVLKKNGYLAPEGVAAYNSRLNKVRYET